MNACGGDAVGGERRAGVEAEPAEPQDAGAEQRQRQRVRRHRRARGQPLRSPSTSTSASAAAPALMCTTAPPAKSSAPISASQPPANTQCATGAYTSDQPDADEHRVRAELHPVGDRAGDQRRRDDRERHLERAEQDERDGQELEERLGARPDADVVQAREVEVADEPAVAGVAEREAEHDDAPRAPRRCPSRRSSA